MTGGLRRYRSADEDSARWQGFAGRPGDIVISSRSKHGTTWLQMICALLVFETPELPEPLGKLSPWLDWLVVDRQEVYATLEAQRHRRIIKTHTPLDGLPLDDAVDHLVVARHPLDAAISLYHQGANLDRARMRELTGRTGADGPRPPLPEWVAGWIDADADPRRELDSLPGVMRHLTDAWTRRGESNVLLVHYDDLNADRAAEMGRIAAFLGITVAPEVWASLVEAAGFDRMRAAADRLVPDPAGVLRSRPAFFRQGRSGEHLDVVDERSRDRYHDRSAGLAPADLLAWLHREPGPRAGEPS